MEDKIKELKEQGKTIREISEILNIGRDKAHRLIKKLESNVSIQTDTESDKPNKIGQESDKKPDISISATKNPCDKCNMRQEDKDKCSKYAEVGINGRRKLRKCDYTKEELEKFPDAPYWD